MEGVLGGGVGAVICFKSILNVRIGFKLSNNLPRFNRDKEGKSCMLSGFTEFPKGGHNV